MRNFIKSCFKSKFHHPICFLNHFCGYYSTLKDLICRIFLILKIYYLFKYIWEHKIRNYIAHTNFHLNFKLQLKTLHHTRSLTCCSMFICMFERHTIPINSCSPFICVSAEEDPSRGAKIYRLINFLSFCL